MDNIRRRIVGDVSAFDLRRSMGRLSKINMSLFEDRVTTFEDRCHDVSTFEDRCVDLRRWMC